jgi:ABC-type proline/glycine betaine transport system permease subunit
MLQTREDAMNNSSMLTADRGTHVKIVVVSLICATIVAGIGIAARVSVPNGRMEATVITVGKQPVTAATSDGTSIR